MSITIQSNISNIGKESSFPQSNSNAKSIDARNLNLGADPIDAKKGLARKQAMKLISDAWKGDTKAEQGIKEMTDEKGRKALELAELKGKISKLEEQKKNLQVEYGVADDSEEQKDLLLLEKYQNNKSGASYDNFSKEEIERLKELQGKELTEYQKRVLEANGAQSVCQIEADKKENELIAITANITNAEIDRLKSQDMLKATDAADEIMVAASKDAVNMMMQEGMEHIEDEMEETKEKADKLREEKEEREEQLEKAKERREEQQEIIENQEKVDMLELSSSFSEQKVDNVAEAQKKISQILKDNHMINEDIKGIEIDLNF